MLHSAYEGLLTTVLLFGVATDVRWVIGPSPISRAIPGIHGELLVVGTIVALLVAALILSGPGKASGGHMNPAISLAMWRMGTFPGRAVVPYAVAQLAGSLLGVLIAYGAWGPSLASGPVDYASLGPGPGWASWLFAVEAASMGVIIFVVGVFLSVRRLTPAVPWVCGALVGGAIAGLGTFTGGSDNPARQFGPAVFAGRFGFLETYLIAPLVGALLAAWLLGRLRRTVLTHRLGGPHPDVGAPSAPGSTDAPARGQRRSASVVHKAPGRMRVSV